MPSLLVNANERLRAAVRIARLVKDLGSTDTLRFLTFASPGHFYSPIPDYRDVAVKTGGSRARRTTEVAALDLNPHGQLELLAALSASCSEMPFPDKRREGLRFYLDNPFFAYGDAAALFGFLRHLVPRKIVEIGSGFSSALMLDTRARFPDLAYELICVEPFPERLRSLLKDEGAAGCTILERPVQEVASATFRSLRSGDILFVDSSHVGKAGSDVLDILHRVLPVLAPGVYIHFHDIFWPFEYPDFWFEEGRAWNEAYLLRAFLAYNDAFEVVLFNDYLANVHRSAVRSMLPLMLQRPTAPQNPGTSSLWLRKR